MHSLSLSKIKYDVVKYGTVKYGGVVKYRSFSHLNVDCLNVVARAASIRLLYVLHTRPEKVRLECSALCAYDSSTSERPTKCALYQKSICTRHLTMG